jgi:hypothetical protein
MPSWLDGEIMQTFGRGEILGESLDKSGGTLVSFLLRGHYGSEGWGFESLRARHAKLLVGASRDGASPGVTRRHPYKNPYS